MKTAEQRCGEAKGAEERELTEGRMMKCAGRGANAFTAGWRYRQSRIRTWPVEWTEEERMEEEIKSGLMPLTQRV